MKAWTSVLAESVAADEAELPQLKEARLAYSRDVINHAELLIIKYAENPRMSVSILIAVFQVSECLHSGFYWS